MPSLRKRLAAIGATGSPLSLRNDLYWFNLLRVKCSDSYRPGSVLELMAACVDPKVSEWTRGLTWQVNNRDWTENCQSIAPGPGGWFISTNAGDASEDHREGLYFIRYGDKASEWVFRRCPRGPWEAHPGALCVHDGWVYVPLQPDAEAAKTVWGGRRAVWKINVNLDPSTQAVLWTEPLTSDDRGPHGDLFPWCDINPHNKLLYTCNYSDPEALLAYDASSTTNDAIMPRCSQADILLKPGGRKPNHVQGACFTRNYRLVLICDEEIGLFGEFGVEVIQVYSTLTGHSLGEMNFPAKSDPSPIFTRNELESVRVGWVESSGITSQLQVLELNNEINSTDDIYLWGVTVPSPTTL